MGSVKSGFDLLLIMEDAGLDQVRVSKHTKIDHWVLKDFLTYNSDKSYDEDMYKKVHSSMVRLLAKDMRKLSLIQVKLLEIE